MFTGFSWRRVRDSNSRGVAPNRISSAARYDHFDNPPCLCIPRVSDIAFNKIHDYNGFVNTHERRVRKIAGFLKEVNIKYDLPTADDAVKRITYNIHNGKSLGAGAVKIIHGYGSTGKGGKIRTQARQYLESVKRRGIIRDYICGEDFSIFDEGTRRAFMTCDDLRRDSDLERHNNGVTIVIL